MYWTMVIVGLVAAVAIVVISLAHSHDCQCANCDYDRWRRRVRRAKRDARRRSVR